MKKKIAALAVALSGVLAFSASFTSLAATSAVNNNKAEKTYEQFYSDLYFEKYIMSQAFDLKDNFDKLSVGETSTVTHEDGIVSTRTRAAENVLINDIDITAEYALNSHIRAFTYQTRTGYEIVMFLTNKDGRVSYAIYDISEDGKDIKRIYLYTDFMSDKKEKIQISDIIAGGVGTMEITRGDGADTLEFFDASGIPTEIGYVSMSVIENVFDTKSSLMNADGDVTMTDFIEEVSDNKVHNTLKVASPDSIGVLTYDTDMDDNIIMNTVKYELGAGYSDLVSGLYETSMDFFNSVKKGEEIRMHCAGKVDIYKKVDSNAVVENVFVGDVLTSQTIIAKSPEGLYLELQKCAIGNGIPAIAFFSSEDGGKTQDLLYLSTVDDSVGAVDIEACTTDGKKYTLKSVTTENPDGTKTKNNSWVDENGNVETEEVIQISADAKKITAESVCKGKTYKHSFTREGDHVTATLDTGRSNMVFEYDMDGDTIDTDSVTTESVLVHVLRALKFFKVFSK